MHSTASDLSWAEEMSALELCNMVPGILDEGAERLDRFGECKGKRKKDSGKEASAAEASHEEEVEEETMDEDDREEEGHEEEDEDMEDEDADDEDGGMKSESHSSLGSMQENPCSSWHYSDRCHCHPYSWAKQSKSENGEDGSLGELSVSENSEGEGEDEVGHWQALPSSLLHEPESSGETPEVVG